MNVVLEYLAVGLLIITIILAFNQVLGSLTPRLESVRAEQLFTVAERVMDKILLTPGYPEDWGRNILVTSDTLKDFGLALLGSRTPYTIDPDKVMRLANLTTVPNPLLLTGLRLAQILALERDYGFRLTMKPTLSVRIDTRNAPRYRVTVVNHNEVHIPGVNVTGIYVIIRGKLVLENNEEKMLLEARATFVKSCYTDATGACELNFASEVSRYGREGFDGDSLLFEFIIVHASWQGYVSIEGASANDEGQSKREGYIIGNYFFTSPGVKILNITQTDDNLIQATPLYSGILNFGNLTVCQDISRSVYNNPKCTVVDMVHSGLRQRYSFGYIDYVDPLSSHVFVFAKSEQRPVVIVIKRIPSIDLVYGTRGAAPANSVTLRRLAVLFNYPYIVELTIWRRVEGWP